MNKPKQQMSFKALHMMAGLEGFVPAPYRDVAGVDTIFFGHTAAAGSPNPKHIPSEMPGRWEDKLRVGFALLDEDLDTYEAQVTNVLGPLEQHEFDGWVMWFYNTGGLYQTSAVSKWKRGDKVGAVNKLKQWNKVTKNGRKVVNQHLVERRQKEAAVILEGIYQNPPIPVWGTDSNRRVIWKRIGTVPYSRAMAMTRRTEGADTVTKPGNTRGGAIAAALVAIGGAAAAFWDKIEGLWAW